MLIVVDDRERLRALYWEDCEQRMHEQLSTQYNRAGIQIHLTHGRSPVSVREPLRQYLEGKLNAIDAIDVETAGTPFQKQVWTALRQVPPGSTASYASLA